MPPSPPPPYAERLVEAAERFGTPLYVYAETVVRERCRRLREALAGLPVRLLYALKANACPALLRAIRAEGYGFDAVSPGEVALLRALGVPAGEILFSATSLSDAEMDAMAAAGVLLNLDDLERLERFGRRHPGAAVCVRFNPGLGHGHHRHVVTAGKEAKFGVPVEAAEAVRAVAARHGLRVVGVHQHIGSGVTDPDAMVPAADRLVEAAAALPDLRFLDLGGGFGVPYRPEEPALELGRLRALAERTLDRLRAARAGFGLGGDVEVWFEPGRYLVAEAGVLLVRVHTLKTVGEGSEARTFAGTDSGFNQLLRPTLYDAYHGLHNLSNPGGPLRRYDVVGNVCESGDLFARARLVQELRRGDLLAICDTGAYGMAMASTYNLRPLPAEAVLAADGTLRLVRRRLAPEELAASVLAAEAAAEAVADGITAR